MLFTRQVKLELARYPGTAVCCRPWELTAPLLQRGYLSINEPEQTLSVQMDCIAQARYLFCLLKAAGIDSPAVLRQQKRRLGKRRYLVQVVGAEEVEALLLYLGLQKAKQSSRLVRSFYLPVSGRCCRRAFIRGVFMAGGSISVSSISGYHLEINCGCHENALSLREHLGFFFLYPFLRRHNGCYSLYLKKAEAIADFLRVIGANSALLHLESARVVKSLRNQVNRLVNCDTANLEKVVTSAQQQLELIDRVDRMVGLSNLSRGLREAAQARRSFPEASLKELGEMLEPPLGKSGMNHRFRQLEQIARKLSTTVQNQLPGE